MREAIDLAKFMGVTGNIVVQSGRGHDHLVRLDKSGRNLHADDAQLNAGPDEAFAEWDLPAGYLFRRRYD